MLPCPMQQAKICRGSTLKNSLNFSCPNRSLLLPASQIPVCASTGNAYSGSEAKFSLLYTYYTISL